MFAQGQSDQPNSLFYGPSQSQDFSLILLFVINARNALLRGTLHPPLKSA